MKKILLVMIFLLAAGCSKSPEASNTSQSPNITSSSALPEAKYGMITFSNSQEITYPLFISDIRTSPDGTEMNFGPTNLQDFQFSIVVTKTSVKNYLAQKTDLIDRGNIKEASTTTQSGYVADILSSGDLRAYPSQERKIAHLALLNLFP